jgi:hypothetical protein
MHYPFSPLCSTPLSFSSSPPKRRSILVYSLLSTAFGYYVTCGCTLILASSTTTTEDKNDSTTWDDELSSGYGLFSRAMYDSGNNGEFLGCIRYSNDWKDVVVTGDRAFRAARTFGVLLTVFTTLAAVVCVLNQLFHNNNARRWWMLMRISFFVALLSEICIYSVWKAHVCAVASLSDNNNNYNDYDDDTTTNAHCVAGTGGVVGAFNVLLLLMVSVASCMVPAPTKPLLQTWKAHYDTDDIRSNEDYSLSGLGEVLGGSNDDDDTDGEEDMLRVCELEETDSNSGFTGRLSAFLKGKGNNKPLPPNENAPSSKKTESTGENTAMDYSTNEKDDSPSPFIVHIVNDEDDFVILDISNEEPVETSLRYIDADMGEMVRPNEKSRRSSSSSSKKVVNNKAPPPHPPRRGANKQQHMRKSHRHNAQQQQNEKDDRVNDNEPIESMRPPVDAIGPRSHQGPRYILPGGDESVQSSLGMTSLRSRPPPRQQPPGFWAHSSSTSQKVVVPPKPTPPPLIPVSRRERKLDGSHGIEIVEEFAPPSSSVTELTKAKPHEVVVLPKNEGTEIVKVSTLFGPMGKRTVKDVTHWDGSRTVTTTTTKIPEDEVEVAYYQKEKQTPKDQK